MRPLRENFGARDEAGIVRFHQPDIALRSAGGKPRLLRQIEGLRKQMREVECEAGKRFVAERVGRG